LGPEGLRGKIALIGVTLSDAGDSHRVIRGWKREEIFGVELHADAITNLERGVAVRPMGPTAQWLFMLALAAIGATMSFLLFDRPARYRRLALGIVVVAYACAEVTLYLAFGILLNVLYDVAAFAAAYMLLGHLQKKALDEAVEEVSP
jgi:CHASE2 domain-containing sensor protein